MARFITRGRVQSANEPDDAMAPAGSHNRGGAGLAVGAFSFRSAYAISKDASIRHSCRHRRPKAV